MIEFKITTNQLELVESSFNISLNLEKVIWKIFQEILEIEESITSLLMTKSNSTDQDQEYKVCLLYNLILKATDLAVFNQNFSSKFKVWWTSILLTIRSVISSYRRY